MKSYIPIVQSLLLITSTSLLATENNNNTGVAEPPTAPDPTQDQQQGDTPPKTSTTPKPDITTNLEDFSFKPALFLISYNDEVLQDTKDVKVGDNRKLNASGSKYSTAIGLEVHYNIALWLKCKNNFKITNLELKTDIENCNPSDNYEFITGHTISPYIGLYDFDNGINGLSAGLLYGYWKRDMQKKTSSSLNIGLGWTVHKDRLVLSGDYKEGQILDPDTNQDDLTERKDVKGITLMVSASIGF